MASPFLPLQQAARRVVKDAEFEYETQGTTEAFEVLQDARFCQMVVDAFADHHSRPHQVSSATILAEVRKMLSVTTEDKLQEQRRQLQWQSQHSIP